MKYKDTGLTDMPSHLTYVPHTLTCGPTLLNMIYIDLTLWNQHTLHVHNTTLDKCLQLAYTNDNACSLLREAILVP